ncbi:Kelch-like protein 38 [Tupaia chinensis]|uniref:Kelch-like protein 38 n=1 Tax=Tupaia chinensis TaxID=246437 RepID=L9JFK9_TUPCH|nr:Kelch-like protein 38 [Tupaia chinensis]
MSKDGGYSLPLEVRVIYCGGFTMIIYVTSGYKGPGPQPEKAHCLEELKAAHVYHISRNTWFKMETRMIKNVCAPAVVLGERIVIVGGYTRRILAYDPRSNKFVKCADMKDRRMHHGATVMGSKLYVTGGRRLTSDCNIEDSASFDCYDPETDTWTSQGQLPHKLFDHACLTLQCLPTRPPSCDAEEKYPP